MPLICRDCENKERFFRINSIEERYTEREYLNQDEEALEYDREDDGDVDVYETGDIICQDCDSDNTYDVSQEEWNAWEGPDDEDNPTLFTSNGTGVALNIEQTSSPINTPKNWAERYG